MNSAAESRPTIPDSRQALVNAIEGHMAREGLTRTGFGLAALGDASFLGRLGRGSDVRVCTADKVLAFMGEEPLGPRFLREIEAWLGVTRTKPHLFGEQAMGDPTFVTRLRRGRSATLATVERVRAFMAANASAAEREAVRSAVEECGRAVPVDAAGEEETESADNSYMNTKEVAAYLGLSPRTLERYRWSGGGPVFFCFGNRVRYLRADVDAWALARRVRSTSDEGQRGQN